MIQTKKYHNKTQSSSLLSDPKINFDDYKKDYTNEKSQKTPKYKTILKKQDIDDNLSICESVYCPDDYKYFFKNLIDKFYEEFQAHSSRDLIDLDFQQNILPMLRNAYPNNPEILEIGEKYNMYLKSIAEAKNINLLQARDIQEQVFKKILKQKNSTLEIQKLENQYYKRVTQTAFVDFILRPDNALLDKQSSAVKLTETTSITYISPLKTEGNDLLPDTFTKKKIEIKKNDFMLKSKKAERLKNINEKRHIDIIDIKILYKISKTTMDILSYFNGQEKISDKDNTKAIIKSFSLKVPYIQNNNKPFVNKIKEIAEEFAEYDAEAILKDCFVITNPSLVTKFLKKKLRYSEEYIEKILERVDIVGDGLFQTLKSVMRDFLYENSFNPKNDQISFDNKNNLENKALKDTKLHSIPTEILRTDGSDTATLEKELKPIYKAVKFHIQMFIFKDLKITRHITINLILRKLKDEYVKISLSSIIYESMRISLKLMKKNYKKDQIKAQQKIENEIISNFAQKKLFKWDQRSGQFRKYKKILLGSIFQVKNPNLTENVPTKTLNYIHEKIRVSSLIFYKRYSFNGLENGNISVLDVKETMSPLIDSHQLHFIFTDLHKNSVTCLCFDKAHMYLFSGSSAGPFDHGRIIVVGIKDMNNLKNKVQFDFGDINMNSITTQAPHTLGNFLFVGSEHGVVRAYDYKALYDINILKQFKQKKKAGETFFEDGINIEPYFDYGTVHQDKITAMVISGSGKFLFTGSLDKSIKIFDIANMEDISGTEIYDFFYQLNSGANCLCIDKTESLLFVGGELGCLKIFNIKDIQFGDCPLVRNLINVHNSAIHKVFVDNDNSFIVTVSLDGYVKIFHLLGNESIYPGYMLNYKIIDGQQKDFCIDEKLNYSIASGGNIPGIKMLKFSELNHMKRTSYSTYKNVFDEPVHTYLFTKCCKFMIAAGRKNGVKIFELNEKVHFKHEPIFELPQNESDALETMCLDSYSRYLFVNGDKGSINIYNLKNLPDSYEKVFVLKKAHNSTILHMNIVSPKYLISYSQDNTLKFFYIKHLYEDNQWSPNQCYVRELEPINSISRLLDSTISFMTICNRKKYLFLTSKCRYLKVYDLDMVFNDVDIEEYQNSTNLYANDESTKKDEGCSCKRIGPILFKEHFLNSSVTKMIVDQESKYMFVSTVLGQIVVYLISYDKPGTICNNKDPEWVFKPIFEYKNVAKFGYSDITITKNNMYLIQCSDHRELKFYDISDKKKLSSNPVLVISNLINFVKLEISMKDKFIFASNRKGLIKVYKLQDTVTTFRNEKMIYSRKFPRFDELSAENCVDKILLYHIKKKMNSFSYSLTHEIFHLGTIQGNLSNIQKTLNDLHNEIFERYSQCVCISLYDIKILTFVLRLFHLERLIPKFIQVVVNNKTALKVDLLEIFKWMVILVNRDINTNMPLNEILGRPLMTLFVVNQLDILEDFNKGSKSTIEKKIMNIKPQSDKCNGRFLSKKEQEFWKIKNYDTSPVDIDVYTFSGNVNLEAPSQELLQYLFAMEIWLAEDLTQIGRPEVGLFIDSLWRYYKHIHSYYQIFYLIPLISLYLQSFFFYDIQITISSALNQILFMSSIILLIYEFFQFQIIGLKTYFNSLTNYIDLICQAFFLLTSVLMYNHGTKDEMVLEVYCVALFFGFVKLYNNLKVLDLFRNLSNSIFIILGDIKSFLALFLIFIAAFTNIFYVESITKSISENNIQNDIGNSIGFLVYLNYFFSSYEYIFGNWDDHSTPGKVPIVLVYHFMYSFLFGIIMVNILIAIVSDSFSRVGSNEEGINTYQKIELIRDAIYLKKNYLSIKGYFGRKIQCSHGFRIYIAKEQTSVFDNVIQDTGEKVSNQCDTLVNQAEKTTKNGIEQKQSLKAVEYNTSKAHKVIDTQNSMLLNMSKLLYSAIKKDTGSEESNQIYKSLRTKTPQKLRCKKSKNENLLLESLSSQLLKKNKVPSKIAATDNSIMSEETLIETERITLAQRMFKTEGNDSHKQDIPDQTIKNTLAQKLNMQDKTENQIGKDSSLFKLELPVNTNYTEEFYGSNRMRKNQDEFQKTEIDEIKRTVNEQKDEIKKCQYMVKACLDAINRKKL